MGGKEGSRGYYYQGIVAVLESLKRDDWDRIHIEFPTDGDKVDIALQRGDAVTDAIQVKSTVNSFSKGDVSTWIADIIKDYPCERYKLILIGNCGVSAVDFISAVRKYQLKQLDKTAEDTLRDFDTSLFDGRIIEFKILPFDSEDLKSLAQNAFYKYVFKRGYPLDPPQTALIVDAMIEDQLLHSTNGSYTDREVFCEELDKKIRLLLRSRSCKREKIGIIAFSEWSAQDMEDAPTLLDLQEKFNGRYLKEGLEWNSDIEKIVCDFLKTSTNQQQAFQIILEAHNSIAFAAGRVFGTKSGIDIRPAQKASGMQELWDFDKTDMTLYQDWKAEFIKKSDNVFDTALVLNVTHDIYRDVECYLMQQDISVGRILNCTIGNTGATFLTIQNGTHAVKLANSVLTVLSKRNTYERAARLHIFAAAPNAFMFYLGQVSRGFGDCILYEYDFEQHSSCSYMPSIHYIEKE